MGTNKRAVALLAALFVSISAGSAFLQYAQHGQDRCAFALTDAQKSRALGLNPDQAEMLEERGGDIADLCTVSDDELSWYQRTLHAEWNEDADKFAALQRTSDDGTIRAGGVAQALRQRDALAAQMRASGKGAFGRLLPEAAAGVWTALGPDPALNPIPLATAGAGRVNTLTFDPTNDQRIFLGGPAGMFVTANGGAQWTQVPGFPAVLPVNSIVVSPQRPSVYFASTGDNYGTRHFGIAAANGAGIYVSTDSGVTWSPLQATDPGKNRDFYYVERLAISPTDPTVLLAGTIYGTYRSADSGQTWTRTFNASSASGFRVQYNVTFDPNNGAAALIAGYGYTGYSADGA